jgi:glycosyltransferase involved in cell wall biosynthesis
MNTPTVSVLMTAYNREKYISDAIESVLSSSYRDFELIIVDDCSQDSTVEIARQYTTDSRVKLYVNSQNLGDYPNRNKAASLAQGTYLKYLDSDDLIYSHGLEIMIRTMERFPDAGLGICRPASTKGPHPIQFLPEESYREHFLGEGLFAVGPSGCILRSEAFHSLNGFSGRRFVGDTEMWLRMAARYPIVTMVGDLIWWRRHSGQEYLEGQRSLAYSFLNFRIAMEALEGQTCPLSASDREKAIRRIKYSQARSIWRLAIRGCHFHSAFRLFNNSSLTARELLQGTVMRT